MPRRGGKKRTGGTGDQESPASSALGPETLADMEVQLNEEANDLFAGVLDCNSSVEQLEQGWAAVMDFRAQFIEAAQAYAEQEAAGGAATSGDRSLRSDGAPTNWKVELYSEWAKRNQRATKAEDMVFEFQQLPGEIAGTSGWVATLTCFASPRAHQSEEVAPNKKLAEQLAAKAALQADFPESFARLAGVQMAWQTSAKQPGIQGQPPQQGQKRKAPEAAKEQNDSKQRLAHGVQVLIGQALDKGALTYEVVEAQGGQFVATVTLDAYDPSVGYQGLPAPNKKLAESLAAEAALNSLAGPIGDAEAAHLAKKAKLNRERLSILKDKMQQKKIHKEV